MTLADTNVWLALCLSGHEHHQAAVDWMQRAGPKEVLFCRSTQQSFLRLLTTAGVLRHYGNPPLTNAEALELYQGLVADSRIGFVHEPADLDHHWYSLATPNTASPKVWMDAYLAAFAIAGRYRLITIDLAFQQYSNLDLILLQTGS
ncbi:PIN domain-containing protein [bacterium]|nr:PIN domain-containing protein [bacterium]